MNEAEVDFFHRIAPRIIELAKNESRDSQIIKTKEFTGDYATRVDVAVEDFIVAELKKYFPKDPVLAEEGYADTAIPQGRMWLVDPICGTNNLGKGLRNYCTNIALVYNSKVIAACVVDHSQADYIWSVGRKEVYVNSQLYVPPSPAMGLKIDIDFGSLKSVADNLKSKHNACLLKLVQLKKYDLISLNTSLGFAYTATGKTDGFINLDNHPWDIAAASFLLQQAGGTLTGLDGSPWTITTRGAIGGRTAEIHNELLHAFSSS